MAASRCVCTTLLLITIVTVLSSEQIFPRRQKRNPFIFSNIEATLGVGPLQIGFGGRSGIWGLIPRFSFPSSIGNFEDTLRPLRTEVPPFMTQVTPPYMVSAEQGKTTVYDLRPAANPSDDKMSTRGDRPRHNPQYNLNRPNQQMTAKELAAFLKNKKRIPPLGVECKEPHCQKKYSITGENGQELSTMTTKSHLMNSSVKVLFKQESNAVPSVMLPKSTVIMHKAADTKVDGLLFPNKPSSSQESISDISSGRETDVNTEQIIKVAEITPNFTTLPQEFDTTTAASTLRPLEINEFAVPKNSRFDVSKYFDINFMFSNVTDEDLAKITQFIGESNLRKILRKNFHFSGHNTRASLLRAILNESSTSISVQTARNLSEFLVNMSNKVKDDGYGSLPPDIVDENELATNFDMNSILEALDYERIQADENALNALMGIREFLTTSFTPVKHVSAKGFMKARAKGQFLRTFFQELLSNEEVPENTKDSVKIILKYVMENGKGSHRVDFLV